MPPPSLSHLTSTRFGMLPASHIKAISTTPMVNGKLKKLCAYFAHSDHAVKLSAPISGSSSGRPKVMLRPVKPRMIKQTAVIQCTKRSSQLKRTILHREKAQDGDGGDPAQRHIVKILPIAPGWMLKHVRPGIWDRAEALDRLELIEELLLLDRTAIRIDLCRHRRMCRPDDHEREPECDGADQREKSRHATSP